VPNRRLIIPFRNGLETKFEVSPWYLSDSIYIREILGDDFGSIYKENQELYTPILSAKSTCLYIDEDFDGSPETLARSVATQVQYVLKTFAAQPILVSHCALLDISGDEPRLAQMIELLSTPFAEIKPCILREDATEKELHEWFTVVRTAVNNHDPVHITLSRFNSSLLRSDPLDKIIDLTVAMESLIRSAFEIKFKFALFNSLLSEPNSNKRFERFELLQTLYDARSSVVHGDITKGAQKKIDQVLERFDQIVAAGQAAINYYLLYLFDKPPAKWSEHLEKLALGVDVRLGKLE
jgi:Apea-like HEPN